MKIKDWKLYRWNYCELCKSLAEYSQIYRLLLSYDLTFLVVLSNCNLVSCSTCKSDIPHKNPKCHGSIHCFSKSAQDKQLRLISAFSVMLQYQKIQDDIQDGNGKLRLLQVLLKNGYKKASKEYPDIEVIVEQHMEDLYALEKAQCMDLEQLAETFAGIFKEFFLLLPDTSDDAKAVLGRIAYDVAIWTYFLDMYDDQEKDKKEGNFNPLLSMVKNERDVQSVVYEKLIDCIEDAKRCLSVLPYWSGTPIIENVLNYGMVNEMKKVGLV